MDDFTGFDELYGHLERTTRLSRSEVARVVSEVLAYFGESAEEFVTRRHVELQREDKKNEAIFRQIAAEVQARRFAAPRLTERQIRRLIYG